MLLVFDDGHSSIGNHSYDRYEQARSGAYNGDGRGTYRGDTDTFRPGGKNHYRRSPSPLYR